MGIFNRHTVSIVKTSPSGEFEYIKESIKVRDIPRRGELIYIEDELNYFNVVNVVHNINKKQDIFIVVEGVNKPLTT